jgi:hypothetical protein
MEEFKHAYWVNRNEEPCYTVFVHTFDELNKAILNNKAIVMDKQHEFVSKNDPNLVFLPAYVFNFETKSISIDIEIAKKLILSLIRLQRNQILEKLDSLQLKCLGNIEKLQKIENVKKELRDLPSTISSSISNCKKLVDLNHISPPILTTYEEMIK